MEYTFFINTASSVSYQVYPLNWLECSLDWEKNKNEQFYRNKFNGSLTFGGKKLCADYNLFYGFEQSDPCQEIYLFILQDGNSYWEGYFTTSMGEWDLDNQTFTVTPLTIDDYYELSKCIKEDVNIINVAPIVTTRAIRGTIDVTYTRNRWLIDVIEYIGTDAVYGISPGSTISSTFFTDATNPVTLDTNMLTLLTIAQKSDIVDPTSSDPSTIALLSWEKLMEILWAMFQVQWDYNILTDTINVEHISWWGSTAGLDIRTQEMAISSNKYKYLQEEMPKYEKFYFMEQRALNFVGIPIRYNSSCVNQDSDSNETEKYINVTTDLEYIATSDSGIISNDGFVILCNYESGGDYYVEFILGKYDLSESLLNNRLSWGNLHDAYFRHERSWNQGYLNNNLVNFYTSKKTKVQDVNIVNCNYIDFDPTNYITTELGETYFGGEKGYVKKASMKPYGEMNLTLVYGPVGIENPGNPEVSCVEVIGQIEIIGNDIYKITFHFNKPIPADIDIRIRDFVYDDTLALQCTGDWNNVTFSTGDLSEVFMVELCDLLEADWCVQVEVEYDDDEICSMLLDPDPESCVNPAPVIYTIL